MLTTAMTLPSQRRANEMRVLEQLRLGGPASRAQLAQTTGLSRATISTITQDLLEQGRVVVIDGLKPRGRRAGRAPETLGLRADAAFIIGAEFGHARLTVVVSDATHRVVGKATRHYSRTTEWAERLRVADDLIASISPESVSSLTALGIGVPGSIAQRTTVLNQVERHFTERYRVPVRIANNARLAGLAEFHWGAAQSANGLAYVRLSNGVGGAIILDGRIYAGSGDTAGEFGHVCIDPVGPLCRCGNRGCLERYVGLDFVLAGAGTPSLSALLAALDRADARALSVMADIGARIGLTLANACNVIDVSSVVLGGDLAHCGDHLVGPVRQALSRHMNGDAFGRLRLRLASLGDLDGALGGVALILQDRTIALRDTSATESVRIA